MSVSTAIVVLLLFQCCFGLNAKSHTLKNPIVSSFKMSESETDQTKNYVTQLLPPPVFTDTSETADLCLGCKLLF